MIHVYPAPGCTIRDPISGDMLPAIGAEVQDTNFWMRRIKDGDVIVGHPPAARTPNRKRSD